MTNPSLGGWIALVLGGLWIALTGLCTWNISHGDTYGFWVVGLYVVGIGVIPFFMGLERVIDPRIAGGLLIAVSLATMAWAAVASGMPKSRIGPATEIAVFVLGPLLPFLIWGVLMTRRKRP